MSVTAPPRPALPEQLKIITIWRPYDVPASANGCCLCGEVRNFDGHAPNMTTVFKPNRMMTRNLIAHLDCLRLVGWVEQQ